MVLVSIPAYSRFLCVFVIGLGQRPHVTIEPLGLHMLGGRGIMWLPSEVRPSASAFLGRTVALGSGSGQVVVIGFSADALLS